MVKDSQAVARALNLPDVTATAALGARIAAGLSAGDLVALEGDLGAGKTTLARAILRSLGVSEDVPSPTFTKKQHNKTPNQTKHQNDLFRIENANEIAELGIDEAVEDG